MPDPDSRTESTEQQYRRELTALRPAVARRIGLPEGRSRWESDRADCVELLPGEDADGEGNSGIFRPAGTIGIKVGLAGNPRRWHSMIHELLHSFSAGGAPDEYKSYKGWEEGVVEHLQRLICRDTLKEIGVEPDEAVIASREADWPFNGYIAPWEEIRAAMKGEDALAFYVDLLSIKIAARDARLYQKALASKNIGAVTVISVCKAILSKDLAQGR